MTLGEKHHTIARDELAALMENGVADDLLDWTPVASSYELRAREGEGEQESTIYFAESYKIAYKLLSHHSIARVCDAYCAEQI